MLATTVSEAEIAELEANAYGWDADDAEDQNAEKIKDFLKARGLPEKPRRPCHCGESHYSFECRTNRGLCPSGSRADARADFFPAELAAGIVDAALEEKRRVPSPRRSSLHQVGPETAAAEAPADPAAGVGCCLASKETLRLNRARLLSASPGLDLTHFGAVELEPVKGREHELGPVPLWNVDAHKLKGAASWYATAFRCPARTRQTLSFLLAAFSQPLATESTYLGSRTLPTAFLQMLGHDPLSQDTLAHAWPTHYYEIMSLTHRPLASPRIEPDAHKLTKLGTRRLRLACASTVAGYFLHRVDYAAHVDARVDAYGFALLALEHAIQWKTVACIGGRAALAERLTAYRDGRAPAFPVVSEGESRTVERVPVEPRVAAARVLHLRDLHLCDTGCTGRACTGQSLARGGGHEPAAPAVGRLRGRRRDGRAGDGDEAPEEAPPPPPPSAIDENLSQRALYEAMGVMSGVLAVPGCPPRLCEGKQITEWPMTARSDLAHRWSIPFDALKGTFEDLRVPHLKAFLASERSTPIQNRLDGPPVPHEEPPEGRVALRADRTVRLARLNAAAFELFMIALGLRGPVTPHSHDLPFHLHEWTEQQLEHFLTLRWTIPATRLPRWTHGGRFNRARPSSRRSGPSTSCGLALTAQRAAFQEKVLHALERHAARQSFTFDDALVGTYIADEPEPRLEPLDIDHVESEEEEGEKEEAPAAIPAAAHRPFEPHKDWQPRPLFSLADPTYANDHKLLREYMDRKHAFFRPWNAMSQVNWFSLVGPPQRPFDEDPELFDLQGLAFPHAACGVSLDIVQYLAVGTRTAHPRTRVFDPGQVSRVLYTAFFHEGGGARNAPPPYMPHPERPTLHTSVLGGNIADPNEEDARTPFATRFARDVAVLALLRPLADKRVENVEGRLQTRRIYAPRLVAGTATPAPNAACDKDVAGGAPHQRENKKLWLAVTVAQLASQPKKSHANPRLVTAFEEILATAIGFTLAWHARFFQRHAPGKHLRSQHWADDFLSAAAMDVESERPADYVPEIARAVADHMDDFNKVLNSFRCVVPDGLMVFIHEAFLTKPTAKPDRGSDVLPQGKKVFDADARPTYRTNVAEVFRALLRTMTRDECADSDARALADGIRAYLTNMPHGLGGIQRHLEAARAAEELENCPGNFPLGLIFTDEAIPLRPQFETMLRSLYADLNVAIRLARPIDWETDDPCSRLGR
eukprot:tig00021146_g19056.t1